MNEEEFEAYKKSVTQTLRALIGATVVVMAVAIITAVLTE